ncbi:hypothetical protein [Demequina globuliformis]|uniref:hypothetical protein n=1 Tax=Demequina globuliformis TaxID=676202 RepID=UPI0007848D2B|nr:hypothetical protein [Demequina globuliformis]
MSDERIEVEFQAREPDATTMSQQSARTYADVPRKHWYVRFLLRRGRSRGTILVAIIPGLLLVTATTVPVLDAFSWALVRSEDGSGVPLKRLLIVAGIGLALGFAYAWSLSIFARREARAEVPWGGIWVIVGFFSTAFWLITLSFFSISLPGTLIFCLLLAWAGRSAANALTWPRWRAAALESPSTSPTAA